MPFMAKWYEPQCKNVNFVVFRVFPFPVQTRRWPQILLWACPQRPQKGTIICIIMIAPIIPIICIMLIAPIIPIPLIPITNYTNPPYTFVSACLFWSEVMLCWQVILFGGACSKVTDQIVKAARHWNLVQVLSCLVRKIFLVQEHYF